MNDKDEKEDALGQRMSAMREELGLSVEALARMIAASPKYIRALESGDYALFGAKVYALGVLKKMLAVMDTEDQHDLIRTLNNEWNRHLPGGGQREERERIEGARTFYMTPTRAGIILAAAALVLFVFFAGSRIIRFSAPPLLAVDEPRDTTAVGEPTISVKGRTEKESKLTVNGRELIIDSQGNFRETLQLQSGLNRLNFLSENRFGKQSEITRYVVVE